MKEKYRILVCASYMQRDMDSLLPIFQKRGIEVDALSLSEEELAHKIGNYDGIICSNTLLNASILNKAKRLKVIVKWGTGTDNIDKDYAKKLGILVYSSPNAFTNPVADTVMAFILAFARGTVFLDRIIRNGSWEKPLYFSLSERTLGIIGFGNIGRAVAKRANSFGMKILANDIVNIPKKITSLYNVQMVNKSEILSRADFISLNCDLNETNHHMLTRKEFELMKDTVVIINTARGRLVKEGDLIYAIENNLIAGAGLDVFKDEPLPRESPLRNFENVLLSPHNANSSPMCKKAVHLNSINKLCEGLKRMNKK